MPCWLYYFCVVAEWFGYVCARVRQWFHCLTLGHQQCFLTDVNDKSVICLGCHTCSKTFWVENHYLDGD